MLSMDNGSSSFLRRTSLTTNQYFISPLIVYKISSDLALKYAILIVKYVISKPRINEVFIEDECFDFFSELKNDENYKKLSKISSSTNSLSQKVDLGIVIGGDGTLLWTNSLFGTIRKSLPPYLTFNLGTLGYLTYYNCNRYEEVLDELLDKRKSNVILEKRSTIIGKYIDKDGKEEDLNEILALNDIVLDRGNSNRLNHLEIYINDEYLTTVSGDGLIFATSTGSTAYSLSAGGTIIHYDVDCLLLNAICPHSLSFRPIAFPNHIELKVVVAEHSCKVYCNNDGTAKIERNPGEGVKLKVSDKPVNLILLEKFTDTPLKVWKDKLVGQLGWSKSFVNTG